MAKKKSPVKKPTPRNPAKRKRSTKPDESQMALSAVERIIGGKLSDGMGKR
jgi:hypothetical protein